MLEWHRRYRAVYDLEHGAGYPDNFTEVDFRELQEMYGFDYAVVPAGSPPLLPGRRDIRKVNAGPGIRP